MSKYGFAGKVVIVTGGASGIGRAASLRFAEEGAAVLVADLDADGAEETVAEIEAAGGRAVSCAVDVASPDDNRVMFEAAAQAFGGVDIAFLNVGVLQPYLPLDQVTLEMFDRVVGINLRGTFLAVQQALAHLRPGGACVVTASAAGLIGFGEAAAYSASKHGVIGLVRSAAAAFAGKGLRINAICPGMVLTAMNGITERTPLVATDDLPDPDYRGGLSGQHVAEVALFLAGRGSAGINGQAQLVDAALLSSFPPIG